MFALNRRHWFAGVAAFVLSSRIVRGANAAQETPVMPPEILALPAPIPSPDVSTPSPRDVLDALLDVSILAPNLDDYWLRHLQSADSLGGSVLARDRAALMKALDRLIDRAPQLMDEEHVRAVNAVSDAISDLHAMSWSTALLLGYALANRDALTVVHTDASPCRQCYATGRLWNGEPKRPAGATAEMAETCPGCAGRGYIKQVALGTYHPTRPVPLPDWLPDSEGLDTYAWMEAISLPHDERAGAAA